VLDYYLLGKLPQGMQQPTPEEETDEESD